MSDREIQGWYFLNRTSEPVRVRLSYDQDTLSLHSLSDRLIARWSLNELDNREIAVLSERWSIGDRPLPDASLVLESNDDYRALRRISGNLRPVRARMWRLLGRAVIESGYSDVTGWPVWLLLIALAGAILGLWHLF